MKNLFTIISTFIILSFSFSENVTAQQAMQPNEVIQFYKNHIGSSNSNCAQMTFVINRPSIKELSFKGPNAQWGGGALRVNGNGIKSYPTKRYWSNRRTNNVNLSETNTQPFAANKTDLVEVVLKKQNGQLVAKLIRNGNTTYNINILGAYKKNKGHIIYGILGQNGAFITISLFKTHCPAG